MKKALSSPIQDARERGVNRGLASTCYLHKVRKFVQCSRLLEILRYSAIVLGVLLCIFFRKKSIFTLN